MTAIDIDAIELASLTDVGRQRTSNQDSYRVVVAGSGARLMIVADGMGGHAGGATASRIAVDTVEEVFVSSDAPPEQTLRQALEVANQQVHARAQVEAGLAGMGTTGVAVVLTPDGSGWVANVGDSRAYRLRDGRLEQLTLDHSLVAELQRRGMLTAEEALVHPRRNEVLRSLGVEPEVVVDVAPLDLRPGDQYLLCSDGLSGVVPEEEIAAVMQSEPPERAVRRLVDAANERGGPDNVTVQIARLPAAAAERATAEPAAGGISRPALALGALAVALAAALLWVLLG